MKTPEEFRNEYAKALGYVDWADLFECYDDKGLSVHETAVMEEYAKHYHAVELSKLKEQMPDGDQLHEMLEWNGTDATAVMLKELLTIKDE